MYEKLAYALVPSGYKANKLYSFVGGDLTFTRTSTATRINKDGYIEFVPTGVPRLNYPLVNGVPSSTLELLLEPARINFQVYSEDFSNAAWSKIGSTIDTDPIIAPDGNLAYAMRETTATSEHRVSDAYASFDGSSSYTFSVFAKHNGARLLNLFSGTSSRFAANANFDLVNGVVYSSPTGTATIEKYPNGWYRCSVTGVSASSGSSTLVIRHKDESLNTSYAGDLNEATYLWGAQLEEGYLTSYIPTFDSTASRIEEGAISGTGNFNDYSGVLFAEIQSQNDIPDGNAYIALSDNSVSNMINIRYTTDGLLQIHNNGTSLSNRIYGEDYDLTQNLKIAVQYGTTTGDYKVFINGVEKTVFGTFSASAMSGLSTVDLTYPTHTLPFLGAIKQVLVFNEALTDSELEKLTT